MCNIMYESLPGVSALLLSTISGAILLDRFNTDKMAILTSVN